MADPLDGCSSPGCDGDPFERGGTLGDRGAFKGRPLCPKCYMREHRKTGTPGRAAANRDVPEPPHGTNRRYRSRVYRCRCADCRAAAAAAQRARRPSRKVRARA